MDSGDNPDDRQQEQQKQAEQQAPSAKRRRLRPTLAQQNADLKEKMEQLTVECSALKSELGNVKMELSKTNLEKTLLAASFEKVEGYFRTLLGGAPFASLKTQLDLLLEQGQQIHARLAVKTEPPQLKTIATLAVLQNQLNKKDKVREELRIQLQETVATIDALTRAFSNDMAQESQKRVDLELTLDRMLRTMDTVMSCSVCLLQWTDAGEHRLVALPCGHIYGESCILRSLEHYRHCPQCRTPCTSSDVCRLFINLSD
ncbi:uncharacterized protein [Drosophila virilis]|uniref:RING-type domain-containing protein n=1 Tax=Drosophila virilis TaxID=7244 RepID=B4MD81_DROVI|nr:uncharacterized protein LOC6635495 [Drosophila virilis]EDW58153.1 uncharacterized protein Dvir_GJ15380 [Drosophila virilis]